MCAVASNGRRVFLVICGFIAGVVPFANAEMVQEATVIPDNPVRTPTFRIWVLGTATPFLDVALNGLEWTLFAWGESLAQ